MAAHSRDVSALQASEMQLEGLQAALAAANVSRFSPRTAQHAPCT